MLTVFIYTHCCYLCSQTLHMLFSFEKLTIFGHSLYFCFSCSPLLSSPICLPMMKLSNSRNFLEHELMILNLLGTRHHYQPTYCLFLYAHCLSICSLSLWCLYATSSWPNDEWHVSEAPTTTFWCFLGVFWPTLVSLFGKQQLLCPYRWWNCRLQ